MLTNLLRRRGEFRAGEIVLLDGGRLAVNSRDEVSTGGSDIYPFGDRTWAMADARALHRADPQKLYQNGLCRVLAADLWCHEPRVVGITVLLVPEDKEDGIHELVRLADGTYADSMGVWSGEALLTQWRAINPGVWLHEYAPGELAPKNPALAVESGRIFAAVRQAIAAAGH